MEVVRVLDVVAVVVVLVVVGSSSRRRSRCSGSRRRRRRRRSCIGSSCLREPFRQKLLTLNPKPSTLYTFFCQMEPELFQLPIGDHEEPVIKMRWRPARSAALI